MNAMDKMIAGMLGITPEGMQQMVTDFRETISTLSGRLSAIEAKQDAILAGMKGSANDDGNAGDGNGSFLPGK